MNRRHPKLTAAQMDPAYRQFLAQLRVITDIDPHAYADWMQRHQGQLREGFMRSHRPQDEAGSWMREQYIRSVVGVMP